MSNTNRETYPHSHGATPRGATGFGVDRTAIIGMSTGIARPASVQRKLEDIARGRTVNAWAHIPEIAEACIDSGGSFHHVTRPLTALVAHLKRRARGKLSQDMKPAIIELKKQCDDAEAMALSLAYSGDVPEASVLVAFDKEADEAILALEHAKELAEDRLAELESK